MQKIIDRSLILIVGLLGCAQVHTEHETESNSKVVVELVDYLGWDDSIQISNGDVKVVVVPQIGRIMHYGFVNSENILWSDKEFHGQTLPNGEPNRDEEGAFAWTNFGGDKVWPNEQSEFEKINGFSWPPDPAFDGGTHSYSLLDDGVQITSPLSNYNGAQSIRTIRLSETGSRLEIGQKVTKLALAANTELEPLRYTIWNVTQIRQPEQTLYPLNPHSHFVARYFPFTWEESAAASNFSVEGDIGIFVPDLEKPQKTGADSDLWLAGIVGDVAMAEFFRRDGTQRYPDGGLSAEVYTCPDYTELELLSPWVYLEIGETLEHPIAWELKQLPASANTTELRRAATLEWLQSK
ncbi:MAG: DUF4380 domain-containing protein [Candidatus Latescibacterota bacterium]|nr:DUF4380 domain-containing protein [Candidatus Latescibacterota bacterium]